MFASRLRVAASRAHVHRTFSSRPLVCDNPYTGETYCAVRYQTDDEIEATIGRAACEYRSWRAVPLHTRLEVATKWLSVFRANADRIARDVSGMMGKPLKHAKGEVWRWKKQNKKRTKDMCKYDLELCPHRFTFISIEASIHHGASL